MQLFLTSVASGVETISYLKENINNTTQLVVLPFASHVEYLSCAEDIYNHFDRDVNNKDSIFWKTVKPFIDIGINPDRIVIINRFTDHIELIKHKLLADNTIVYLPGGYPENIVKILKELKLIDVITQCKIVVGESAGSMFWSRKFFVYPDSDYPKYKCYRGIKFIKNFVIIPHYNDDDIDFAMNVLNAAIRFKKFHKEKVYMVRDGGWVRYDSEKKKIISYKDCFIVE